MAGRAPSVPSASWCCAYGGNPCWGYRRIHGELLVPGIKVAASTMWWILARPADPAPEHTTATWAGFLRSPAEALLACGFSGTVTLTGARLYLLAVVIEHGTRRIRVLGATPDPGASGVDQAAKNLVMDLEVCGARARFLFRDRDGKFPGLSDAVLKDAGVKAVLSGLQMPRMNSITERWVQTCRHELLDRTLIWNQRHLLRALREYEHSCNQHRSAGLWPMPHRYQNRSPIPSGSRASMPADGPARRNPPRVPACRLTSTDQ